jgi:hypothetical protein
MQADDDHQADRVAVGLLLLRKGKVHAKFLQEWPVGRGVRARAECDFVRTAPAWNPRFVSMKRAECRRRVKVQKIFSAVPCSIASPCFPFYATPRLAVNAGTPLFSYVC